MANVLTTNPIVIDTAGATSGITAGPVRIRYMVWVGKGTAGDDLLVHNKASGDVIWGAVARTANYMEQFVPPTPLVVPGFYVTTLDTGTLYVYV